MKILVFKKKNCEPCQKLSEELEGVDLPLSYIDIEDPKNLSDCEIFKIRKVPTVIFLEGYNKKTDEWAEVKKRLNGKIDGSISVDLVINTYNKLLENEKN